MGKGRPWSLAPRPPIPPLSLKKGEEGHQQVPGLLPLEGKRPFYPAPFQSHLKLAVTSGPPSSVPLTSALLALPELSGHKVPWGLPLSLKHTLYPFSASGTWGTLESGWGAGWECAVLYGVPLSSVPALPWFSNCVPQNPRVPQRSPGPQSQGSQFPRAPPSMVGTSFLWKAWRQQPAEAAWALGPGGR